jgi:hypothetical protein
MATTVDYQRTTVELLQRIAREDLPALVEAAEEAGRFIPRHVERTVERFLTCGDPKEGFAWLVCDNCDHHRLVPFSCKTRGICSSCGGRRMATRAAWLVDRVIPQVPVRQWVLTLPWERRLVLARRTDLLRGVWSQALAVIHTWYRYQAAELLGLPPERARGFQCGAVTQIQRFSSALSLNPHFHSLIPDGAWFEDEHGRIQFVSVHPPTTDEIEDLVIEVAERCERWLAKQGFGEHDLHDDPDPDDAQMLLQAASAAGRAALGQRAGRRARRIQVHRGRVYELPPRCAVCDGYNLHAGVRVAPLDRKGLERLCRYIARPPLARERLEEQPDGSILLRLKTPWSDGTAALQLSRSELLQRILALIPPPRKNDIIYHGVFAPNQGWRSRVIPEPPVDTTPDHLRIRLTKEPALGPQPAWMTWAALLWRVFQEDRVSCPRCGEPMKVRTVVMAPATMRVVKGLEKAAARAPPELLDESARDQLAVGA